MARHLLVDQARELRGQGMKYREIATALGISVPYANELVRDPDGWRERRRRPPPPPRSDSEVGVAKMARLISEEVGFDVDRKRVMWAAREGKIPSRRGAKGRRDFEPDAVLAAIREGKWRPHRQGASEERKCGNRRCTKGPGGTRMSKRVPRSQLDRLRDDESPWTCSRECTAAVMASRDRNRGPALRRQCGCLVAGVPCPNWIVITQRNATDGTGPRICPACKKAGRRTEAQLESARRMLAKNRDTEAARAHRSALGEALGKRNADDADLLDRLIAARMARHAERKAERRARITEALQTDPGRPDKAHARDLGTSPALVAKIRYELGIPLPSGKPQTPPKGSYVRQERDGEGRLTRVVVVPLEGACEYTPELREYVRKGPGRRHQERDPKALERARQVAWLTEDGWTSEQIADVLGVDPVSVRRIRKKVRATGKDKGGRPPAAAKPVTPLPPPA